MHISIKNISRQYEEAQGREQRIILDNISLELQPGASIAITGPSGSGKSTLLNLMGLLDTPSRGHILFDNVDMAGLSSDQMARMRSTKIGFVFQLHHLLPQCTVLENVLVPTLAVKNISAVQSRQRALELLEVVGLKGLINQYPAALSGGERQRTAVVRALINQPGVILADEPTGSLDSDSAQMLIELLSNLNREQKVTLVLATHNSALARQMGQLYNLNNGTLTPS